jgi:hypothetical protein
MGTVYANISVFNPYHRCDQRARLTFRTNALTEIVESLADVRIMVCGSRAHRYGEIRFTEICFLHVASAMTASTWD